MTRRCRVGLSAGALAAALLACARPHMPVATAEDARRGAQRWPEVTLASLERGRQLYVARCSTCHQPVPPGRLDASEWPAKLAEMIPRAHLDDDERALVERYVLTLAERRPQRKP